MSKTRVYIYIIQYASTNSSACDNFFYFCVEKKLISVNVSGCTYIKKKALYTHVFSYITLFLHNRIWVNKYAICATF